MTTAGEIISRVNKTLFDETNVRWSEAELLEYITDAQKEVVMLKPSAYALNESVQLTTGTLQSLPANGLILIELAANMGADGNTPGKAVSQIDRTILESVRPNWRAETADINARHYMYDDRDPNHFEVYPPQPATAGYVQLIYGAIPVDITDVADQISLKPIYDTPIKYLVLAQCFSKSTGTQDFAKASAYQQLAVGLITGRKQTKQQIHPEQMQERLKR